jgi:N-methylhydantoinase A
MAWMIGVDVGGTFTDFFAFDDTTDRIVLHKVPSTPVNPALAVIPACASFRPATASTLRRSRALARHHRRHQCADPAARRQGRAGRHRGFRDLIEIGRQIRPHVFSLQQDYPAPLVPRELRFEAPSASPPTAARSARSARHAAALVQAIGEAKPDACAVCLCSRSSIPRTRR